MATGPMRALVAAILRLAAVLLAAWTLLSLAEWTVAWRDGAGASVWLFAATVPIAAVALGVAALWRMASMIGQPRPLSWPVLVGWMFRGLDQLDAIVLVAAGIITAVVGSAQLKTHLLDLHAGASARLYALGFDGAIVAAGLLLAARPALGRGLLRRLRRP